MMPKDKELHFWAGVWVSFAALILFKALDLQYCWLWVLCSVLTAAIGKELKDLMDYGVFDYRYAVYTIAGGCIGVVLSLF